MEDTGIKFHENQETLNFFLEMEMGTSTGCGGGGGRGWNY